MIQKQLKDYRDLIRNINYLTLAADKLKDRCESITSNISSNPSCSNNSNKRLAEETLHKRLDLLFILDRQIDTSLSQKIEIERAIEHLPEREKLLMRLRYIEGFNWEQVAKEMCYSRMQVHRFHGQALKEIIR